MINWYCLWFTRFSWRIFSIKVWDPFVCTGISVSSSSTAVLSAWRRISFYQNIVIKYFKVNRTDFISRDIFTWLSCARCSFFTVVSISEFNFEIVFLMTVLSLVCESIFISSWIGEMASVVGWYNTCSFSRKYKLHLCDVFEL